jgi:hypothetical protein
MAVQEAGGAPDVDDDPSVLDPAELWRRIPPLHLVRDDNGQRIRISSAAFDDDDDSPMSVVIGSESDGPDRVLANHHGYGLAYITAQLVDAPPSLMNRALLSPVPSLPDSWTTPPGSQDQAGEPDPGTLHDQRGETTRVRRSAGDGDALVLPGAADCGRLAGGGGWTGTADRAHIRQPSIGRCPLPLSLRIRSVKDSE